MCGDGDRLGDVAHFELRLHAPHLIGLQRKPALHELAKAGELHGQVVAAGWELRERERAIGVRGRAHCQARAFLRDGDRGPGHDAATRIDHRADDSCLEALGGRSTRESREQHEEQKRDEFSAIPGHDELLSIISVISIRDFVCGVVVSVNREPRCSRSPCSTLPGRPCVTTTCGSTDAARGWLTPTRSTVFSAAISYVPSTRRTMSRSACRMTDVFR